MFLEVGTLQYTIPGDLIRADATVVVVELRIDCGRFPPIFAGRPRPPHA